MIKQDRLIKTFIELVKIDSPSGEEQSIAEEVSSRLKKLGAKVEKDTYGNIFAKFQGTGEPIMLNAHLDTVEPGRNIQPILDGDYIRSNGSTILGADPKAGLSAILEAITSLKEEKRSHLPLEVVLTLSEETGLSGAVNLDYKKVSAKRGVTFDGEYSVEMIDISAPGYIRVDAEVIGKSAHAGAEPEKGLSAIRIAAEIITELQTGRVDEETTANIGLIEGGSVRNAVPESVWFKGEIRSRDPQKLKKHARHFEDIINQYNKKYPEAKIELLLQREFEPYAISKDHPTLKHVIEVQKRLGLQPKLNHSGGGTDVNIFHAHGINAIVVGTGGFEAHTTREYAQISEILKTAKFCEELVKI